MKLYFEGMSLKDLRESRENLVQAIGQLRNGLFNADAALGLKYSIDLLMDLYVQITTHYNKTVESLPHVEIDHAT